MQVTITIPANKVDELYTSCIFRSTGDITLLTTPLSPETSVANLRFKQCCGSMLREILNEFRRRKAMNDATLISEGEFTT
jgi:hypothetical protein